MVFECKSLTTKLPALLNLHLEGNIARYDYLHENFRKHEKFCSFSSCVFSYALKYEEVPAWEPSEKNYTGFGFW